VRLKLILILFLLPLLLGAQTTWYVATTGNDVTGDGTLGNPWLTVKKASTEVAVFGDIIYVKPGTYTESQRTNLALGVSLEGEYTPTTIINYTYNAASFSDGAIYAVSGSVVNGNQHISNLTITGSNYTASRGIYTRYRNNFHIYNCTIQNFDKSGINAYSEIDWVTPPATYTTGLKIYNCDIDNNTESPDNGGECNLRWSGHSGYEIYSNTISSLVRVTPRSVYSSQVKNGSFHDNIINTRESISGEWLFACELFNNRGGIEIYDNQFIGGGTLDIAGHTIEKGIYSYAVSIHDNSFVLSTLVPYNSKPTVAITIESWVSIESVYIYRNYIKNFPWGINVTMGTYGEWGGSGTIDDLFIYTNIIENSGSSDTSWASFGIGIIYQATGITRDNINIWNNTITGNQTYSYRGIYLSIDGTNTNINFQNNIIQGFDLGIRVEDESAGNTGSVDELHIDYNLFHDNGNSNLVSFEAGISITNYTNTGHIIDDPEFVSAIDFHLSSDLSPAYMAGMYVDVDTDYDGDVYFNPPSIGAYEYGSVPSGPTVEYKSIFIDGKAVIKNGKIIIE